MTTEALAEYERIRTKYAPARPRDVAIFGAVIGLLVIASFALNVDWAFVAGAAVAYVA